MTDRIDRVRLLIADQPGAGAVFTDQEIQAALEAHPYGEGEYDVYGAAAELLEMWAAREKLNFDFSADGAQYRRSQKVEMLLQLAAQYRRRQRPRMIPQVRGDLV
jgi:hypothetical protein